MAIDDAAALAKIREAVTGKSLKEAADALGVSKSGLSNTLTTLRKQGVDIQAKRAAGGGRGAKPKFDTDVTRQLAVAGADHVAIAKHLTEVGGKKVASASVRNFLEREGLFKKAVPLDEALAKIGLPASGSPVQVAA